jgi:hypothetical protein
MEAQPLQGGDENEEVNGSHGNGIGRLEPSQWLRKRQRPGFEVILSVNRRLIMG